MDSRKNVAEGTAASLKSSLRNRETIRIELPVQESEALDGLSEINHVYDVHREQNAVIIRCDGGEHNLVHIINYLVEHNLPFGRVTTALPTLNDVFLEITGKELRD
jgi:ABC-2 type transport system ATP-binding protein